MSDTDHAVSLRDSDAEDSRSWWLLPHLHDSLGDRYLSFAENGAMVEMLRVRDAWASRSHFADAVRQRVRDLAPVGSPWVSAIEIVEPAGAPGALAVVSEHCATRLVEVQTDDAATALAVLEQVLFATSMLHRVRTDVAHGAIDAARVGLVEGHVRLLEPCFGAAIAALAVEGESVWGPAAPIRRVGQSADVVLCARVGMGLLTGEPFTPEKPRDFAAFDDRVLARCTPEIAAWFRRAMHMDAEPWSNATSALEALQPLLSGTAESRAALVAALGGGPPREGSPTRGLAVDVAAGERAAERAADAVRNERPADAAPRATSDPAGEPAPLATVIEAPASIEPEPAVMRVPHARTRPAPAEATPVVAAPAVEREPAAPAAISNSRRNAVLVACVVLLVIVVAAQAVYIVRNLASTTISVSAPPPVAAPPQASSPVVGSVSPVSLASTAGAAPPMPEAAPPPPPEPRTPVPAGPVGGWLAVPAPIELDILRGGELVGTSRSSRLMLPEGRHTLELVNQEIGFRQTVVVTIAPGRETTAPVKIPDGVVHANALPWAEVFIDGNRAGETPLGNLQVPLGRHEVLFRHPTLGERRQTILVTAGAPARISVDLRR